MCAHLYTHFTLPNGKQTHFYHAGKKLVDEVVVSLFGRAPAPLLLADIMQPTLPKSVKWVSPSLTKPPEAMPGPYRCPPEQPPAPEKHTLNVVPHE